MKIRAESRLSDCGFRQHCISEAAYYLAEKRNFLPGMALNDWLLAENEFVKMLIIRYLGQAHEDGGLTIKGLQRLATSVGVENAAELTREDQLVHYIQKATNDYPCFNYEPEIHCTTAEDCIWKAECKQMIAKWHAFAITNRHAFALK
jgi:hypothetical protein